jgi:hypothetical protein
MLGSSRVAAQLAASQEGLSSMSDDVDDEVICNCPYFDTTHWIHQAIATQRYFGKEYAI